MQKKNVILKLGVICIISFHLAFSQDSEEGAIKINCKDSAEKNRCGSEQCRFKCPVQCDNNIKIWGTRNYTLDSSICISAIHDFRISSWDSLKTVVTLKYGGMISRFYSTTRNNITSNWFLREQNSSYYFISGRISETIYDISTVYDFNPKNEEIGTILECHGKSNALNHSLIFGKFIHDRIDKLPAAFISNPPVKDDDHRQRYEMNVAHAISRYGAFYCSIKNLPYPSVVAIINDLKTIFILSKYTVTASQGETVDLHVKQLSTTNCNKIKWMRDGNTDLILANQSQLSIRIENANIEHTGIYSVCCDYEDFKSCFKRGIIRLFVRSCPKDIYGPLCEYSCSKCLNGGICHDITGQCICAPGFKGKHCEKSCGANSFGQNCDAHCVWPSDENGCKYKLICLPDPYGCSCATGFKGSACKEECSPGEYGAGCQNFRRCHCADKQPCNRFTGECEKECDAGWKSPTCHLETPALATAPLASSITSKEANIHWQNWSKIKDYGNGEVFAYAIAYKKYDSASWSSLPDILANVSSAKRIIKLTNLEAYTKYQARVWITDADGYVNRNGSPDLNFMTLCGAPAYQPESPTVSYLSSRNISLTWQQLPLNSWRCHIYWYTVKYKQRLNDSSKYVNVTTPSFTITSLPYMTWYFQIRASNPSGSTDWTTTVKVQTNQEDPLPPRNLQVIGTSFEYIDLLWNAPFPIFCQIEGYIIIYSTGSDNETETRFLKENELQCIYDVFKECSCYRVTNLSQMENYTFSVRARCINTNFGKLSSPVYGTTINMSLPHPPETVLIEDISTNSAHIKWQAVVNSGLILHYRLNYTVHRAFKSCDITFHKSIIISSLEVIVSSLCSAAIYYITVESKNTVGYSAPINISFHTKIYHKRITPTSIFSINVVSENVIKYEIKPLLLSTNSKRIYYIIVNDITLENSNINIENLMNSFEATQLGLNYYITAGYENNELINSTIVAVGNGMWYGMFYNKPLSIGRKINISVVVELFEKDDFFIEANQRSSIESSYVFHNILILIVVLLLGFCFLLLLLFIIIRQSRKKSRRLLRPLTVPVTDKEIKTTEVEHKNADNVTKHKTEKKVSRNCKT